MLIASGTGTKNWGGKETEEKSTNLRGVFGAGGT